MAIVWISRFKKILGPSAQWFVDGFKDEETGKFPQKKIDFKSKPTSLVREFKQNAELENSSLPGVWRGLKEHGKSVKFFYWLFYALGIITTATGLTNAFINSAAPSHHYPNYLELTTIFSFLIFFTLVVAFFLYKIYRFAVFTADNLKTENSILGNIERLIRSIIIIAGGFLHFLLVVFNFLFPFVGFVKMMLIFIMILELLNQ